MTPVTRPTPRPSTRLPFLLLAAALAACVGCSSGRSKAPEAQASTRPAEDGDRRDPELMAAFDAYEQRQYAEAARLLRARLETGEAPAEAYSLAGLTHLKLGDLEEAELALVDGRTRFPDDVAIAEALSRLFMLRGRQALEAANPEAARSAFARSIQESPRRPEASAEVAAAYREMARGLVQAGDPARALALLDDHDSLQLSSSGSFLVRAEALQATGRAAEAAEILRQVRADDLSGRGERERFDRMAGRSPQPATGPRPGSLLRRGLDLLERGQASRALAAFRRGLERTRDPEQRRQYLAGAYQAAFALKDYPAALDLARQRVAADGEDLDALLDYGRILAVSGDPQAAREHYETLLLQRGAEPRVRLALAEMMVTQGEVDTAKTHLLALLDGQGLDQATEVEVFELLGVCCAKKGDLACAEQWWKRLVAVDPNHGKTFYNLGYLNQKAGRYREAVRHFEAAVRATPDRDPNYLKYLDWLGLGYRQNGQTDEMCRSFEKMMALASPQDPYHEKARNILSVECGREDWQPIGIPEDPSHPVAEGYRWLQAGDERRAGEAFGRALEGGPDRLQTFQAHAGLGIAARRSDDLARAVYHLERALQARSEGHIQLELAKSSFDLGLYQRSLVAWRKLGNDVTTKGQRRYEVGRCLDHLGRYEEAMEAYEEALSADPRALYAARARTRLDELLPAVLDPNAVPPPDPSARSRGLASLARVHLEQGEVGVAEKIYQEIFAEDPDSPDGWAGVGYLRRDAGDLAGAEEAFRRVLARDPQRADAYLELARLVLTRPDGLRDGFTHLARARELGGHAGVEATREMVRLYRRVGQAEDAVYLLRELAGSSEAPPEAREWAQRELESPDPGAAPTPEPVDPSARSSREAGGDVAFGG